MISLDTTRETTARGQGRERRTNTENCRMSESTKPKTRRKKKRPTSPARSHASRQNGCQGRGPPSDRGKSPSRWNRLEHGAYAESAILPGEDAALLEARLEQWPRD